MVKNCCVSTCKTVWNPSADISLFSFPWKNDALMQEWIEIVPTNRKITPHSCVCSLHFPNESVEQKFGRRILKKDAIPTLFGDQERSLQDSRDRSPSSLTSPTTNVKKEDEIVDNTSSSLPDVEMKTVGTQVLPHHLKPSTRELDLQRKIKILQGQLRRRDQKLMTMSQLTKKLKVSGTSSGALEEMLTSKFSGFNLELFRHQAKNCTIGKTKRSYSKQMNEFALTLYSYSPKAYAYVRKQLGALPHAATLRKWVAECSCKPGCETGDVGYLKAEPMESEDVALIIDEQPDCLSDS